MTPQSRDEADKGEDDENQGNAENPKQQRIEVGSEHHTGDLGVPDEDKFSDRGWRAQTMELGKDVPPASVRWSAWLGDGRGVG